MNEPMTFLDFFSGVGGFRKGFELCGMVCKGHCEIDKFADRSYRAIHDVKEDEWYGEDITKTKPADLPRVNLWAGGFPCQDISVSGRQRGLAGKRSSLFFEIVRLLKGTPAEDRPEWLVLENVKNLLSVNRGWDFATVLHSLAEIGYHIEYGLLNSRFHGVPQNRERIYLVAYRHFRAEGGRKVFPVTAGDGKALIQLIDGNLEASYPSSTTMLALCVLPTGMMQLKSRIHHMAVRRAVLVILGALTAFMVVGRLISGVHWLTDIIGGVLLSVGLVMLYAFAIKRQGKSRDYFPDTV